MPAESTPIIDSELLFFTLFGVVAVGAIVATAAWFIWRYNRKRHPVAEEVRSSPWLEAAWVIVPTILALGMFRIGLTGYLFERQEPPGGITVQVTAFQFGWRFEYENGRQEDRLYAPLGEPVHLRITSQDVVHDFFVPAFRIKQDAVPGLTTRMWFRATQAGEYDVFCAEYCGVGHSMMNTRVVVLPKERFEEWYRGTDGEGDGGNGEREGGAGGE